MDGIIIAVAGERTFTKSTFLLLDMGSCPLA